MKINLAGSGTRRYRVPYYEFNCRACGSFDRFHRMAEVPGTAACPDCAAPARRRVTAGALLHTGSTATRLLDATAGTADRPAVVSAPPAGGHTRITRNPLHAKLPHP
ncbi:FmdB family zinc ribbon protein [Nocardia miyunensis]|uniref:FmdB family zinc ribbon protein n=1 Tax=Nocardia miyunensis TaxID=282684 RepID=UPI00082F0C70|nr:FmdB family zinc ribbon protein [Nocardia miyunensis]